MHLLIYLLVSASSITIISGASLSSYDPNDSSLDDSSFWNMRPDGSQDTDFFSEHSLGFKQMDSNFLEPDSGFHSATFTKDKTTDAGATVFDANPALSSTNSDSPRSSENEISSCTEDDNQASKRDLDRTREMCPSTLESPEVKPIIPQIPSILNLGSKNRISNDLFKIPWDDSPCYPPYTAHVCCSGPVTPLDLLSRLYANVVGCSLCSFCAHPLCSFGSCTS